MMRGFEAIELSQETISKIKLLYTCMYVLRVYMYMYNKNENVVGKISCFKHMNFEYSFWFLYEGLLFFFFLFCCSESDTFYVSKAIPC